ncbi:sugar transferase [Xinfangfangia pollutisoli]|uniref:sugar transferase n=1 Tax=Xinfangfangia pollutisoli TaxID=2865960 RepID=UPI001CD70D4D|nr:sugar transferase [Xinfangfangia pollutisoli]
MEHTRVDRADASALGDAFPYLHGTAISPSRGFYQAFGKRVFDIVLALLALPTIVPVVGLLWLMVKRSKGPGFYGHMRVGRNGKPFRCWKLRTMEVNAEEKLKVYLAENPTAAAEWARDRKLRNDPRVTRIGRFLRKTSLDELPQIWNVLKGEMSFVGPRPVVRDELDLYGAASWAYLRGRPGVTGLWQISGRNDVSYERRVQFDVDYRKTESLGQDIRIVLGTVAVVIRGTGS